MIVDFIVIALIILLFAFLIKRVIKSIKNKDFGSCHKNCKNCSGCSRRNKHGTKK